MKLRNALLTAGLVAFLTDAAIAGPQTQPQPQPRQRSHPMIPAPPPVRPPASPSRGAALLPATQALLDAYVRDDKMPGIVTSIGYGDLPTVFLSAGKVSDEPGAAAAGPDTLWRVYSMTKPITGIAAMILIEDGKLGLDDPLSKYFPAFANMKVLTSPDTSLDSRPAARPITIRNLLTHTAGLGYSIVTRGPLQKEYERLGIMPAQMNRQLEAKVRPTRPATLAEFANRVATLPLIADPGTKWSYSIGLDVLGAVIEKASGMPFDRFVQTRIFDPLKMRSSYWTVPASQVSRLASNYTIMGKNRLPMDLAATSVWLDPPSFPYGGAGLVSSARDYDAFLHMLQDGGTLNGVRIMKPETTALAMSNLLPPGVLFRGVASSTGGTQAQTAIGFGAGGSVYLTDGPGGTPGKGTYGWGGAAGTVAYVDPTKHVRGTIMVNYFPAGTYPLREDIAKTLMQDAANLGRQ